MKVAYLFTGYRGEQWGRVMRGEDHGAGFWGMPHLSHHGVTADIVEMEQVFSVSFSRFLRRYILSMHTVHLPIFWKLFQYDIIFSSTGFGSQFLMTMLSTVGIPCPLWVMHDFSITGLIGTRKKFRQKVFAWMVSHTSGIITVSRKEADILKEMFPHLQGKIAYIPFGTDLNFFRPLNVPRENLVIVAGTDPDRDYETLFVACKDIDAEVLVTTLPDRLKRFAYIPKNVHTERFPLEKLPEAYARASASVIPLDIESGRNDAMGCSVTYESLAMGKAIVATRTPTIESYITDGENGLLVHAKNSEEMKAAIKKILTDDALRMRLERNARAYAEAHLDARKCAGDLADYFSTFMSSVRK